MFDVNSLLQNDTVKGLLAKVGVDEKQAASMLESAVGTIKNKFSGNSDQMSSLLAPTENTADDNKMAEDVEGEFLSKLSADDNGIDDSTVAKLKGEAMPAILHAVTGQMKEKGAESKDGVAGMLGGFFTDKDGDGSVMDDAMDSVKSKLGGLFS